MEEYSVIGKRLPRVDGVVKITGSATYADDLILPGMLHGKLLRSPYAHAKILNIDTSKAERLPGVRAVITGKDFPGIQVGFMRKYADRAPIAIDKVRYCGEVVAAVAATEPDIAEEALDLIDVEYEELPVVINAEQALAEGAPLIHDYAKNNIAVSSQWEYGDVDKAFKECDYVREQRLFTQRVTIGFIEPHAALASVDASGRVLFQGSKQSPYITWRHLCWGLDIPLNKVRLVNPYVGGAFSGKHDAHDLDFCAVKLAQKTRKPVKIVLTQDEVIGFYRQRHAKDIWLKLGVKKDGTLVAGDCKLIADGGAYLGVGPLNIFLFGLFLNIPFRLPNLRYESHRVYTNTPICGAVRGQAQVIACYAFSTMMDIVANDMGMDVADMMLKNTLKPGEVTPNGVQITTIGLEEGIKKVMQGIGWKKQKAKKVPNRGLGIACGSQISGLRMGGHFASSALVKLSEDGTVNLVHGGTEIGQGCDTVFSQMVAEVLGIPLEDVIVGAEDGYDTFFDSGMFGDRCTVWTGNAVVAAAEDVRSQLADIAAEMLGVKPEELVFRDRKVYVKDDPEKSLPFLRVVRNAQYGKGNCIYGHGSWAPPGVEVVDFEKGDASNLTPSYSFVAQAVEIEVDPETGKVKMLNSVTGDDSGQPMNELLVDGQIEGGAVHMIGQGLFEQSLWDEKGRPLNPSFMDYKMPTAMDSPKFTNYHIITNDPRGPFGAKGAGETATTTMMAAITNAVYDAVGVRITKVPMTAEKIYMALKDKKGKR